MKEQLLSLINGVFGFTTPSGQLTEQDLTNDFLFHIDQLDAIEIAMAIEVQYECHISDDEIDKWDSFESILKCFEQYYK